MRCVMLLCYGVWLTPNVKNIFKNGTFIFFEIEQGRGWAVVLVRNIHTNWLDQVQWTHINQEIENIKDKSRQFDIACQMRILPIGLLIILFLFCANWISQDYRRFVQGMLRRANQNQMDELLSDKFPCSETECILWRPHSHSRPYVFTLFLSLCSPSSPFH